MRFLFFFIRIRAAEALVTHEELGSLGKHVNENAAASSLPLAGQSQSYGKKCVHATSVSAPCRVDRLPPPEGADARSRYSFGAVDKHYREVVTHRAPFSLSFLAFFFLSSEAAMSADTCEPSCRTLQG